MSLYSNFITNIYLLKATVLSVGLEMTPLRFMRSEAMLCVREQRDL